VKQPERSALPGDVPVRGGALDPVRVEQFLALQHGLFEAPDDDTLPDRLAQAIATFVGVGGAAVGVLDDGVYRLLATYGLPPTYASRYDGASLRDSELAPALASGRPLVLAESTDHDGPHTTVLPFTAGDPRGAVHLVTTGPETLGADDLQYARTLALLAGMALGNAQRRQRLAQVARLKGDALAAMAHDLRAPLNALIGYAGLLGDGVFGPLTAEQRDVSGTLERQAIELVDLLGATLDVARLETGQLPLRREEFALADLLDALRTGTFARPAQEGRLVCRVVPGLPALRTDRVKVKEIVQNLVDNALKHGAGQPVEVEASPGSSGETIVLTVRNAGGIPADLLPHLFEPFRAGNGGGTGFGLYIVRCFSEALGGRVSARSVPGEDTVLTVELPIGR
jgi:signal transduction histidine kinase